MSAHRTAARRPHQVPSSPHLTRLALAARLAITAPLMMGALGATFATGTHAQQQAPARAYDIPSGPLTTVLARFVGESGIFLAGTGEAAQGKSSPGLRGSYTPEEGLAALLSGTGLDTTRTSSGTYVLRVVPAPARGASALQDSSLPEVKVTAQSARDATSEGRNSYAARAATIGKLPLSLREIPQSVTVITRQRMDDQNLISVTEALRNTTGVIATGYFGQETPSARGYAMSEQHDGVPQQGGSSGLAPDLDIYDRVEILRGASGLLSGSGEPGGTVNYVRKRPQHEFALSGTVSAGSWNNRRAEFDVAGPLNSEGTLRGRAVGVYQERDFFYDVAHLQRGTAYLAVEYDLTPRTTAGLSYAALKRTGESYWGLPTYLDGRFIEDRSAYVGLDRSYLMKVDDALIDLKHRFDNGWEAKGTLSWRMHDFDGYGAYGSTGLDQATGLGNMMIGRIQSQTRREGLDVNVGGPVRLFGHTHTLLAGYNKARQDYIGGSRYVAATGVDMLNTHDFGALTPQNITSESQTVTVQSGFYGMARVKVADPLTVVLGARWTDYLSRSRAVVPTAGAWTTSKANANNEFSPYGGVIWDATKQVSLYASYADIFVPQTQTAINGNTLDPRVGEQLEAGVKAAFLDGALNASFAVFRIRDENRAMIDADNIGCGGTVTGTCYVAAGLVQSDGWEAEISGSPLPGWDLSAGYTYNETKYARDSTAANVGQPFNTQTPRQLLRLWSQYRFNDAWLDGALKGWNVGAGVQAQSGVYSGTTTATVKRREQPGYAVTSLQIGYRVDAHWSASLAVNNLFDRHYYQLVGGTGFANLYGDPRNVMLTVKGRF